MTDTTKSETASYCAKCKIWIEEAGSLTHTDSGWLCSKCALADFTDNLEARIADTLDEIYQDYEDGKYQGAAKNHDRPLVRKLIEIPFKWLAHAIAERLKDGG